MKKRCDRRRIVGFPPSVRRAARDEGSFLPSPPNPSLERRRTLVITVLICTRNPRAEYLARVLSALRQQDLALSDWELLVIDNRSDSPLGASCNVGWHPQGRILREETPGKSHALLLGLREAQGEAVVIVDDDNVLAPDYLAGARRIMDQRPEVAVCGGRVSGEFEGTVPSWVKPYLIYLAINDFRPETTMVSRAKNAWQVLPAGAGMVIRTGVARAYFDRCKGVRWCLGPGAGGQTLARSEDTDMVYHALDQGYAMAHFPELRVTHLIPKERLTCRYLARLRRQGGRSEEIVQCLHGLHRPQPWRAALRWMVRRALRRLPPRDWRAWWVDLNADIGRICAWRDLARDTSEPPTTR